MRTPRTFVMLAALFVTFGCAKASVIGSSPGGGGGGSTGTGQTGSGGSAPILPFPPAPEASVQADAATVKSKVECDGGADTSTATYDDEIIHGEEG